MNFGKYVGGIDVAEVKLAIDIKGASPRQVDALMTLAQELTDFDVELREEENDIIIWIDTNQNDFRDKINDVEAKTMAVAAVVSGVAAGPADYENEQEARRLWTQEMMA